MQEHNQNTADTSFSGCPGRASPMVTVAEPMTVAMVVGVSAQLYGNLENKGNAYSPTFSEESRNCFGFRFAGIGNAFSALPCQLSGKIDDSGSQSEMRRCRNHADEQIQKGLGAQPFKNFCPRASSSVTSGVSRIQLICPSAVPAALKTFRAFPPLPFSAMTSSTLKHLSRPVPPFSVLAPPLSLLPFFPGGFSAFLSFPFPLFFRDFPSAPPLPL